MRRIRRLLLLTLGLFLLAGMASADTLQEKTFAYTGARWASPSTEVAAFWEAPMLNGGETRTGGTLTLENSSSQDVTLTLTEVALPYDDAAKMAYLGNLHLQIWDGDTSLYNDVYSLIETKDIPVIQATLQPGESKQYDITLFCSFQYTDILGDTPIMAWTFDSAVPVIDTADGEESTGFIWDGQTMALVISIVGAVVFGLLFLLVLIKLIRQKHPDDRSI